TPPSLVNLAEHLVQAQRLRFPIPLEKEFRADYYAATIFVARIAILMAAVLYAVFYLHDIGRSEHMRTVIPTIRFGLAVPAILLLFALSFTPLAKGYWQPFSVLTVLAGGSFDILITWITRTEDTYYTVTTGSLMLVLFFAYFFGRLRFRYASAAGWG